MAIVNMIYFLSVQVLISWREFSAVHTYKKSQTLQLVTVAKQSLAQGKNVTQLSVVCRFEH